MIKKRVVITLLFLVGTVFAGSYDQPVKIDNSTIALWNMDVAAVDTGGKVYIDSNVSVNTNLDLFCYDGDAADGNGATLVASQVGFGNCLKLDGINDLAKTRGMFISERSIKVETWVYVDSANIGTGKKWLVSIQGVLRLYFDSLDVNSVRLNMILYYQGGGNCPTLRIAGIPKGQWVHVTANFLDGQVILSVLGIGDVTYSMPGKELLQTATLVRVGTELDYANSEMLSGKVDDIKISVPHRLIPPQCGDWGYSIADINKDCYVDFKDLVAFISGWLYE